MLFDYEIFQITLLSLAVSGVSTLLSLLIGLPLGTWLALGKFSGRSVALSLVNTGMALPPVVVGLVVAMMLWRSGPLGDLNLIYTPAAMVIAQTIIAAPVVTGLTVATLQQIKPELRLQLLGLGASQAQMILELWREARLPLLAALMAGFGSVISGPVLGACGLHGERVRCPVWQSGCRRDPNRAQARFEPQVPNTIRTHEKALSRRIEIRVKVG